MKLEDLMINDLVQITEPDDYHGYIGTVKIINSITGYITVFINDGNLHDVFIDDLQPIPLTVEILEKNGFEKEWEDDMIWYRFEFIKVEAGENFKLYGDHFWIETIRIIYVHELQHALKLCGIEKEIVL